MSAANRAYLDFILIDQFKRVDEVIDAPELRSLAADAVKREPKPSTNRTEKD
jgi:hypothetical protein